MRSIWIAMLWSILSGPAFAYSMICTFEQECFEGEACAATSFDVVLDIGVSPEELSVHGSEPIYASSAELISDAETVNGLFTSQIDGVGTAGVFVSHPGPVSHVMTIGAANQTRYVAVFTEDGFLISYSGTCVAEAE